MCLDTCSRRWLLASTQLVVLILLAAFCFKHSFVDIVRLWNVSDTFAHCYFVIPVSAWLVWRKRDELARITPRTAWFVFPLVAAVALVGLLADILGIDVVQHAALVSIVILLIWFVIGTEASRVIAFPLAFLLFAAPMGDELVPWLMGVTADLAVLAIRMTGIPVFREGLYFTLPSGQWSVVEACSGIAYLIASITLSSVYAYLELSRLWTRTVFMIMAVVVPIIGNGLRAYMIVMIAHLSDNKLAKGVDHLIYGWIFFGLLMLALFGIGGFLRTREKLKNIGEDQRPSMVKSAPESLKHQLVALMLGVSGVLAWPLSATILHAEVDLERLQHPEMLLLGLEAMKGVESDKADPDVHWRPAFSGYDAVAHERFRLTNGIKGQLDVLRFSSMRPGNELIARRNTLLPSGVSDWREISREPTPTGLADGRIKGQISQLQNGLKSLTVYWWYQINEDTTAHPLLAKLLQAGSKIAGHSSYAYGVFLVFESDGYFTQAESALLVDGLFPAIDRMINSGVPTRAEASF